MKIEHKLSPGAIDALQETQRHIRQTSERYWVCLGQAKEAEIEALAQQRMLQQQITMIQRLEQLPESRVPYALSGDGTALIGETPDPPAAKSTEVWPRMTNGSGALIETHAAEEADAG